MNNVTPRKLNRVVLKEELVALTGCFKQAIILNQLMYWSERVRDFDQLIAEEQARDPEAAALEFRHGWIYKTSEELAGETMLGLSKSNMRTHIKRLVAAGWVAERRNPRVKLDHTLQYRVNFVKLRQDLLAIGYDLHGYVFDKKGPEDGGSAESPVNSNRDTEFRNETSRHESKQQYQRLHRDYKKNDRLIGGQTYNPQILAPLSQALRDLYVNDTASLYDHYFDDIYAALCRQFPEFLEPDIVRRAADIYRGRTIDERTFERKLTVYNPVGLFVESYKDALAGTDAIRWREAGGG